MPPPSPHSIQNLSSKAMDELKNNASNGKAMLSTKNDNIDEGKSTQSPSSFQPTKCAHTPPRTGLPDELWTTVLQSLCTYPPEIFLEVMLNLVKNPNITSSHLFRADIFYDSEKDHGRPNGGLRQHLKNEYQPIDYRIAGYDIKRVIVRQLIPRNPQLDTPLMQTCLFFSRIENADEEIIVVYLPHIQDPENMPFYHPSVARLAFFHKWNACQSQDAQIGSISISYCLFPNTTVTTKLERTALRLLETIHKHGQGQLTGYEKRVHLDQIIPQKRYQDTYARLKARYGKQLSEQWVEVTDPGKHVFEDIGIAAFLIELWRDMYRFSEDEATLFDAHDVHDTSVSKPSFPGFVDIGCGNGVLVYILLAEGYKGWGFDARERKTWNIFPDHVQQYLQRRLLVPKILQGAEYNSGNELWQDGMFEPGTFIISNHADELTAWTPLLACLNDSAFIAIPCCSHDLSGARFRAPVSTKSGKQEQARLPQQGPASVSKDEASNGTTKKVLQAETGSLKRTEAQKKMPSAYSSLCSYVTSLAEEFGFEPEKEVLRIPSTRNQAIIGRRFAPQMNSAVDSDTEAKHTKAKAIIERETGKTIELIAKDWIERAEKLSKKPGSGH